MVVQIPSIKVSNTQTDQSSQCDRYMDEISPIFTTNINREKLEDAQIDFECYNAGRLIFAKTAMKGTDFQYFRDLRKIALTGLDLVLVQIILHGADQRQYGNDERLTQPGDVCLADLSRPFNTATQDCGNYSFVLPRNLFADQQSCIDQLHGLHLPRGSIEADLITAHMHSLWSLAPRMSAEDVEGVALGTMHLFADLVSARSRRRDNLQATEAALLLRLKRFIDQNLPNPHLTPTMICKAMGLSRSSLFKIAQPIGGVAHHIRRRRLQQIFFALVRDSGREKSITEIAEAWGFLELSTFFRAFRTEFGLSPGDVREAGTSAFAFYSPAQVSELRLPQWLNLVYTP